MDVWRYSDWYGRRSVPDVMNSYPMIWRWRDWIVRSIEADVPYDRMVVEMLAADELCPDDLERVVATGYLVRSWFKWNYETWKKDLVEHVGKAFLGLSLNCAQCHDHKFDPVSQADYFRRGRSKSTSTPRATVPSRPDWFASATRDSTPKPSSSPRGTPASASRAGRRSRPASRRSSPDFPSRRSAERCRSPPPIPACAPS